MTPTIAYIRVSTERQATDGVSLDAQRAKLEAYAVAMDLDLVRIEVDAGLSARTLDRPARTLDRPALDRALTSLRTGEAGALLVVKLDRLTRSVRDLGDLLDRCAAEGWALLSVGDSIDTRTAAGRLVINVLGSVAQWEREATAERTRAALAYKKTQGERVGSVPYGYRAEEKRLVTDPGEAQAVAIARELRATGASLRSIGAELAKRGFTPRRGSTWHPDTVSRMVATR